MQVYSTHFFLKIDPKAPTGISLLEETPLFLLLPDSFRNSFLHYRAPQTELSLPEWDNPLFLDWDFEITWDDLYFSIAATHII